jgi:ribosome-associated heat shock protein Hsp15
MVRIDKFLWSVRFFKTRSLSALACKENKVQINGVLVKSSKLIGIGDVFSIKKQGVLFQYIVLVTLDKRVGAKLVNDYIVNITSPEEIERFRLLQLDQKEYRKKGLGRPTKKERRDIDDWSDNQNEL